MVKIKKHHLGVTLVELMIAISILGLIVTILPGLLKSITRFSRLNTARLETVRDARDSLGQINKALRQAVADSIQISHNTSQPPYSKIYFQTIDGRNMSYYQDGKYLKFSINGSERPLTENLRYIAFTYPRTDDAKIISVSITLEKSTYEGGSKALQMAIEKVRIMN